LQMKCMHIDTVANFPFPTPPDRQSLRQAERMLTHLGALEMPPNMTPLSAAGGTVTGIGRTMSLFPLSPRFSKMLVSSRRHGCLPYAIAIVSAMSVGDPFLRDEALGVEDVSESEEEMAHIGKEKAREKEKSRHRRRAYFQSQQVLRSKRIFRYVKLSFPLVSRISRQVNERSVQGPICGRCL
jgi:ATP-dependent RNA helicase DHX37/DHR1